LQAIYFRSSSRIETIIIDSEHEKYESEKEKPWVTKMFNRKCNVFRARINYQNGK